MDHENHSLSGVRCGAMVVLGKVGSDNGTILSCKCDCGSIFERKASSVGRGIKLGREQSCGCTKETREILSTGGRTCPKCNNHKPSSEFASSSSTQYGLQIYCKDCYAAWRSENYASLQKYKKDYFRKNKKVLIFKKREYARKNKKMHNEYSRAWRRRNPEKRKMAANKYWRSNPDKMAAIAANRRARKINATPKWADLEKIKKIYSRASLINAIGEPKFHVDHIVPLVSDLVCGLHCEANLRIIPGNENISKGNRFWPDMPGEENA